MKERFAVINIAKLKRKLARKPVSIRVVSDPPEDEHGSDPSHALVIGLPPYGTDEAEVI